MDMYQNLSTQAGSKNSLPHYDEICMRHICGISHVGAYFRQVVCFVQYNMSKV